LPKRSKNFIAVYIDGQLPIGTDSFLLEDNLRESESLYVVGRCLSTPENGQCPIMVLNPSASDIMLYKNMIIAKAFPISPCSGQVSAVETNQFNHHIPPEADWESAVPKFPMDYPPCYDIAQEVDLTQSDLIQAQKDTLLDIIRKHINAFVGTDGHLGHYNGPIRHRIDLIQGATIPARKIYRVPLEKRQEIEPPRLGSPFVIETDSSAKGVAGVLKQEQDNELRIIAFASRTLNAHEARYPAIELEALGLVFAVQKFRPYIDGAKTTIITDYSPLKALLHRRDLTGRLAKYQIVLQEFDISIIYRPGNKNTVCDALSRYPPQIHAISSINNRSSFLNLADVRDEQNQCLWITEYKNLLKNQNIDYLDHPYLLEYLNLNDILYRIPPKINEDPVLVLPDNSKLKHDLISKIHSSRMGAAHLGISKTQSMISKIAIWNNTARDIRNFVVACKICQLRQDPSAYRVNEPLHEFGIPTRPWERVHSDVIGPLPMTLNGNKFLLVFIDAFSKYIIAEPIPDPKG
uniref:RNA-directed DNA polymerase n=1 Tax=Heligmosomoides polygyrus TaxID=6339 RepID=A0A183G5Q0_HELPZ